MELVDVPSSPEPHDPKDLFASDDPALQAILDQPVIKKCKIATKTHDPTFDAKKPSSVIEASADLTPKGYAGLNKALKSREKKPMKAMKAMKAKKTKPMKAKSGKNAAKEKDAPEQKTGTKSLWGVFLNKEHSKVYGRVLKQRLAAGGCRAVAKARAQVEARKRTKELREERAAGKYPEFDVK